MSTAITVMNGCGRPSRLLYVACRPAAISVVNVVGCTPELVLERFGSFVGIVLPSEVPPASCVEVEIRDEESRLVAGDGAFIHPAETPVPFYPPGPTPLSPGHLNSSLPPPESSTTDPMTRMIHLLEIASIQRSTVAPEVRRSAWFMWYLDNYTYPHFLRNRFQHLRWGGQLSREEAEYRCFCVARLMGTLTARAAARWELATKGVKDPRVIDAEVRRAAPVDLYATAHLALAQAAVIRAFFPDISSSPGALEELVAAFGRFTAGELLLRRLHPVGPWARSLSQGAPDGPAHFLFAEFAFLALELGAAVDAVLWGRLLPIFVGAQTLFRHAYADPLKPVHPRTLYGGGNRRGRPVPETMRRSWYGELRELSVDELIGKAGESLVQTFSAPFNDSREPGTGT